MVGLLPLVPAPVSFIGLESGVEVLCFDVLECVMVDRHLLAVGVWCVR